MDPTPAATIPSILKQIKPKKPPSKQTEKITATPNQIAHHVKKRSAADFVNTLVRKASKTSRSATVMSKDIETSDLNHQRKIKYKGSKGFCKDNANVEYVSEM
jgi:hypothetical protein